MPRIKKEIRLDVEKKIKDLEMQIKDDTIRLNMYTDLFDVNKKVEYFRHDADIAHVHMEYLRRRIVDKETIICFLKNIRGDLSDR